MRHLAEQQVNPNIMSTPADENGQPAELGVDTVGLAAFRYALPVFLFPILGPIIAIRDNGWFSRQYMPQWILALLILGSVCFIVSRAIQDLRDEAELERQRAKERREQEEQRVREERERRIQERLRQLQAR